jgi:transketolase
MKKQITNLSKTCKVLRLNIIKSLFLAKSGHPGSALSCVEILAGIFFNNKKKPRVILSKGHAAPALYAIFLEKKLISKKDFFNLRKINSKTQGHPDLVKLKHVDSSTGALGQGPSIAIGYALASKLKGRKDLVYCILGDGELQEGQIWEALLYIGANKITNICLILDNNKFQNELKTSETLNLGNIKEKIKSFGFKVIELNGHDLNQIIKCLNLFKSNKKNKPIFMIANTIKGKGVSFMENQGEWHSKVIDENHYTKSLLELSK